MSLHCRCFKQAHTTQRGRRRGLGIQGRGACFIWLAGLQSSQLFEKSIFKHLSACTADFWQGNLALFQKLCWIWKTTITISILSCRSLRTIRIVLYSRYTLILTGFQAPIWTKHTKGMNLARSAHSLGLNLRDENLWPDFLKARRTNTSLHNILSNSIFFFFLAGLSHWQPGKCRYFQFSLAKRI